jgi:DNA-binding MarR family transcriptional regulator
MAESIDTTKQVPASCTALRFRKAARRVSQIYDACLAQYGLTITQFGLLAHIRRLEGISIGGLAAELVMDPTTLTRNLRPLQKRDLVLLAADTTDKRARRLQLTSEGRALLKQARPGWEEAQRQMAEVLASDLGPLSGAIDRMLEKLSE